MCNAHIIDVCVTVLCPVPDRIHAFVLSDELNEFLDSQTELKTTLPKKKTTDASKFKPEELHIFIASILPFMTFLKTFLMKASQSLTNCMNIQPFIQ